jgi:hypothetical protein
MNSLPIVYARATVVLPAHALSRHAALQQHVSVLIQQPDYRSKQALVAIHEVDLQRLFPEKMPREFYVLGGGTLNYISMKELQEGDRERFGTIIALDKGIVETIFENFDAFYQGLEVESEQMPNLRMTVLLQPDMFANHILADRLTVMTKEEFDDTHIMQKFDESLRAWVSNEEPIPEDVVKPRIHLKDIPLTSRASRRMIRETIEKNRDQLESLHQRSASQLSFDEWMEQAQGVNVKALKDLEAIDALPDDKYVEAIVAFKKAEVQAYHSQEVKDEKTDMHLFDWTKLHFNVEFNDLGRAEAEAELQGLEIAQEADYAADGDEPAVFLVTFDGTIVEDQRPSIGPESPYALGVLKALVKNGHKVFIFSDRQHEDEEAMFQFFTDNDFHPVGAVNEMQMDGQLYNEFVHFLNKEDKDSFEFLEIDYLVDHRQFGISTIQISNNGPVTYYWADLVQQLLDYKYLTEDDVVEIMEGLQQKAEEQ